MRGKAEAAARLGSLDPAREAVAEGIAAIPQNGGAKVQITGYEGDVYRARTRRSIDAAAHCGAVLSGLAGGGGWPGGERGPGGRGADGCGGSGGRSRTGGALSVHVVCGGRGDQWSGMVGVIFWLWWGFRRRGSSRMRRDCAEQVAGLLRVSRFTASSRWCSPRQAGCCCGPDAGNAAAGTNEESCRCQCDKRHQQGVLDQVLSLFLVPEVAKCSHVQSPIL